MTLIKDETTKQEVKSHLARKCEVCGTWIRPNEVFLRIALVLKPDWEDPTDYYNVHKDCNKS